MARQRTDPDAPRAWFHSESEECWNCDPKYSTRPEAIAAGRLAYEGRPFYVAQGSLVTPLLAGRWAAEALDDFCMDGRFESDLELGSEDAVLEICLDETVEALGVVIGAFFAEHGCLRTWWDLTGLVERIEGTAP